MFVGEYDWMTGKKKEVTSKDAIHTIVHPSLKRSTDMLSAELGVTKIKAGGLIGSYLEDDWDRIVEDLRRRQGGKKPW